MHTSLIKNIIEYGVIGVLGIMAFVSVWVWIERLIFYKTVETKRYTSLERLEIDLSSRLNILSTFGANAPYIGLLGTVLGIMVTFSSIGDTTHLDASTIIKSLALALKATAMGLVVAIPAIFFHNHLARKAEVLASEWEISQEDKSED